VTHVHSPRPCFRLALHLLKVQTGTKTFLPMLLREWTFSQHSLILVNVRAAGLLAPRGEGIGPGPIHYAVHDVVSHRVPPFWLLSQPVWDLRRAGERCSVRSLVELRAIFYAVGPPPFSADPSRYFLTRPIGKKCCSRVGLCHPQPWARSTSP
jgi:hypothetical protein